MPYPGDQHQSKGRYSNDYSGNASSNTSSNLSTFNDKEVLNIRKTLSKQLGPEYISHRPGGGGLKVPYLEGWKVINLANDVFGFNGWSSEIRSHEVDYCDEVSGGKFNVGMSAKIRVTLRDGTYREDVGYGQVENARSKGMAFDKCKKEATTDALKRALRLFGNALGNCLYDSSYTRHIGKVKAVMPPLDESQLIRRPEIKAMQEAAAKKEAALLEANNTANRITAPKSLPVSNSITLKPNSTTIGSSSTTSTTAAPPLLPTTVANKPPSNGNNTFQPEFFESDDYLDDYDYAEIDGLPYISAGSNNNPSTTGDNSKDNTKDTKVAVLGNTNVSVSANTTSSTSTIATSTNSASSTTSSTANTTINTSTNASNNTTATSTISKPTDQNPFQDSPVQFFSARAATALQKADAIPENSQFDPNFQSPSIRRTVPNKSVPIKKSVIESPTPSNTKRFVSPLGAPSSLNTLGAPRPLVSRISDSENENRKRMRTEE